MVCPNCGAEYNEEEKICKNCNAPLANASYKEIPKKRRWPYFLAGTVLILAGAGFAGYHYYIQSVESACTDATNQIFEHMKAMDFSDMDLTYIPEEWKDTYSDNTEIRSIIKENLNKIMEESNLLSILNVSGVSLDTDQICDDLVKDASYEITDVSADYHSCTVTVKTSNLDYSNMTDSIYEEVISEYGDTSSLWDSVKEKITDFLFGSDEDDNGNDEDENDLSSMISDIYENARDNCSTMEETGELVYGIKDGKWTILSMDEKLFYTFYGLHAEDVSDTLSSLN